MLQIFPSPKPLEKILIHPIDPSSQYLEVPNGRIASGIDFHANFLIHCVVLSRASAVLLRPSDGELRRGAGVHSDEVSHLKSHRQINLVQIHLIQGEYQPHDIEVGNAGASGISDAEKPHVSTPSACRG
jgi:hypothetical protein